MMASLLMAALAAQWIRDGTAVSIVRAVRAENTARQLIAHKLLRHFKPRPHLRMRKRWLWVDAARPPVTKFLPFFVTLFR
jgi:hypothetical protein